MHRNCIFFLLTFVTIIANSQSTPEDRFLKDLQKSSSIHDTIASVVALKASMLLDKTLRIAPLKDHLVEHYPHWVGLELNSNPDSVEIKSKLISHPAIKSYILSEDHLQRIVKGQAGEIEDKLKHIDKSNKSKYIVESYYKVIELSSLGLRDSALVVALEIDSLLDDDFYPAIQLFTFTNCISRFPVLPDDLLNLTEKSILLSKKINEYYHRFHLLTSMQVHFKSRGDYKSSMEYGLKAIEAAEKGKRYDALIRAYCNLASYHQEQGNFDKAFDLIDKAEEVAILNDLKKDLAITEGARAFAYMNQKKYDDAIGILRRLVRKDSIDEHSQVLYYTNLIDAYNATNELDSAYVYYQKYLTIDPNNVLGFHNYIKGFVIAYFIENGDFATARNYAENAYEDAVAYEDISAQALILKEKARLEELEGNHIKALEYYKKHFDLEMDFRSEEKATEVATTQLNSDFEKEREITALKTEQEKALIKSQRNQAYLLGGSGLLLAVLAFGFLNAIKKKNKQIEIQNEELVSLNSTKDTLFQIIGHDLKKPTLGFRNISKNINYLLKKGDYSRLQALGDEIDQDAKSLYNLTDNLLNWALIQKDAINIKIENVSVYKIVEDNIQLFGKVAALKKIEIVNDTIEDLYAKVDHNSFDTIIRNLMDNAIKYTPEGGQIKLTAKSTSDLVNIQIEDSGPGFKPSLLDKLNTGIIVESSQGTIGEKGSGIGLLLVKNLLSKNNGRMELSNNTHGARIYLSLPKAG